METSSLFSSDSTCATTSKKQRSHLQTLTSGITRFLQTQNSKTSLRSQSSGSSGWSRALVLWRPRFNYSPSSSRTASVNTIPVYPTRDPIRLQNSRQTAVDDLSNVTKALPALPTDADPIINLYKSLTEAVVAQTIPAPLLSLSREERKQRACQAIEKAVREFADVADGNFVELLDQRSAIFNSLYEANELDANSPFIGKEIFTIVNSCLKTNGTASSISIAQLLVELMRNSFCSTSLEKVLQILSILGLSPEYHDNVFCMCAQAIAHEPRDSVPVLVIELSTYWMNSLATHLSNMSLTLIYSKVLHCEVLVEGGDLKAAQQIWTHIKHSDVSITVSLPWIDANLQYHLGCLGYCIKDYTTALQHFERAHEICVQERYGGLFVADICLHLSWCHLKLRSYRKALEQAELAVSNLANSTSSKFKEKVEKDARTLLSRIQEIIDSKGSGNIRQNAPHDPTAKA